MIDFASIAGAVETDPFIASFGMLVDYSAASLIVLDAFLDETWGTTGKIKEDPAWQLSQGNSNAVMMFGSYCGEVLRRAFGGRWNHDPTQSASLAAIALPGGWSVLPISKAFKRLRDGAADALHPLYDFAREKCGAPRDEAAGFKTQISHYEARSRLHASPSTIIARLNKHMPVTVAAGANTAAMKPGTRLANCPKCGREAVSGKPHCIYCGGPLVVPASCPKCNRKNAPNAKKCMYCTTPLGGMN